MAVLKTRLALVERRQQPLTGDDRQLAQKIGLEQSRRNAINEQLDQVERSLKQQGVKR